MTVLVSVSKEGNHMNGVFAPAELLEVEQKLETFPDAACAAET